ncbi:MAG: ABC transporter transmembrane domain-containing protein, partial [Candidatus Limivicinus sp.]
MKNFLKYMRPYKWWVLLTVVFIALQSLCDLFLPDLNATIIDEGVMKGDVGTILLYGGVMLLVALLVGVCTLGTTYFSTKASLAYGRDMRLALFTKVQ